MAKVIIFHTPIRYGGGERQLVLLSKEFKKLGLDFLIINLSKSLEFENELQSSGIKFITINNRFLGDSPSKKTYLKHLILLTPHLFNKKLKNLWNSSEVVWANDFPANFLVYFLLKIYRKKNKKLICLRHFYKNPEKGIFNLIYKNILNSFDLIVGVSDYVSDSLIQTFPELKNKILTIPNGIDLSEFELKETKEELRENLNLPQNETLAIYVARFSPQKNHSFLINVVKEIPNLKIILIGDGKTKNNFIEKANKENVFRNFIILGYVKNELIPYYLKASDFCLFPSLVEGFGIAIVEALAAGLPTVIFKNIYIKEFEDGLLVAKNEKEFIELAKKLYNETDFRQEISKKGLKAVQKFDIKNIAKKYIEILKK